MRCNDALPLLSGYLDEQLPVDEMRRVAAHLETCRSCEGELRRLEKVQALLRSLDSPVPRAGFWSDAYEKLGRQSRPLPWWQRLTQPQRSVVVLAPAFVAAALALMLQLQPAPSGPAPEPVDRMDDLVQAHLEARVAQPLSDASTARLLLMDAHAGPEPTDE